MKVFQRAVLAVGLWKAVRYLRDWIGKRRLPGPEPEQKLLGPCFMPGELLLLGQYPAKLQLDPEALIARLDPSLTKRVQISPKRVMIFRSGDQMLPVLCASVPGMRQEPKALLALIEQLNREFDAAEKDEGSVKMMMAAPNWLAAAGGQSIPTGGPGAHPVAPGASAAAPELKLPFNPAPGARASGEVQVVILDTAPHVPDLRRAYRRWVAGQLQPHPMLQQLLEVEGAFGINTNLGTPEVPGSCLEISYAEDDHLLGVVGYDLLSHPYVMSDHGLFIAGLVRALAPRAQLHVIEVLNPFGVGSLESVLRGLALILERYDEQTPLVVNCSFVLSIPQPGTQERYSDTRSLTRDGLQSLSRLPELLWNVVLKRNVVMVAAAGNDGQPGAHPAARFPASHPGVVGVGALRADTQPAEYTNRSDQPLSSGLATFGGDVQPASPGQAFWRTDPTRGILSVYIGGLPDGTPNVSGWARWAGTSFAAPLVAGALASRMAAGETPQQALEALRGMSATTTPVGASFPIAQL